MAEAMAALRQRIRRFAAERDWDQFHAPKNLAMALSVEASEVVEIFQWLTEAESWQLEDRQREHLEEEIGDVMIYLTALADKFDLDPLTAAGRKLRRNRRKYPADLVRGSRRKPPPEDAR